MRFRPMTAALRSRCKSRKPAAVAVVPAAAAVVPAVVVQAVAEQAREPVRAAAAALPRPAAVPRRVRGAAAEPERRGAAAQGAPAWAMAIAVAETACVAIAATVVDAKECVAIAEVVPTSTFALAEGVATIANIAEADSIAAASAS
jgi:hypothetical protein